MDEIPELVTEISENSVIKIEKVPVVPFVPSSLFFTTFLKILYVKKQQKLPYQL
ncbi:hypothetical protein MGK_05234 [Candida albicans P57055]|nr:hypothetical protein MGK_05234 [Candida albicans P57055]